MENEQEWLMACGVFEETIRKVDNENNGNSNQCERQKQLCNRQWQILTCREGEMFGK